jgi:hypothetical protein
MAGRPSKYDPEVMPTLAAQKMREGYTREMLAEYFGVTAKTIYEWQDKFSEFREALKSEGAYVDAQVENALLRRALGGIVTNHTVTEETTYFKDGTLSKEKRVEEYGEAPPDTTSMIFWLKNRQPARWRDVKAMELTGKDGGPIETADKTTDQKIAELAEIMGRIQPEAV